MQKATKLFRKILFGTVGLAILIIGILLIPLPGPGLLVCLLGLFILSLEFVWAQPYMEKVKKELSKFVDQYKARRDEINRKYPKKPS